MPVRRRDIEVDHALETVLCLRQPAVAEQRGAEDALARQPHGVAAALRDRGKPASCDQRGAVVAGGELDRPLHEQQACLQVGVSSPAVSASAFLTAARLRSIGANDIARECE